MLRAGLFIDEEPLRITLGREGEKKVRRGEECHLCGSRNLLPDQMGWAEDGSIYFPRPKDKRPSEAYFFQPPLGLACGMVIACFHITVCNVTAMHAANDGFNIHDNCVGWRKE